MRDIIEAVLGGRGDWAGLVIGTSFVDVIELCLSVAGGPCVVSTAAIGKRDSAHVVALGARLYVAYDMIVANKKWQKRHDFPESIRMHRSHAKCALFGHGFSLRTTANLTKNVRWETYIFSVDPVVFEGLHSHFRELDDLGSAPWRGEAYYRATLDRSMGGNRGDADPGLVSFLERIKT